MRIYDNEGRTKDRYMVIVGLDAFTMSDDPDSITYFSSVNEKLRMALQFEKEIPFKELPITIQRAIRGIRKETHEEPSVKHFQQVDKTS